MVGKDVPNKVVYVTEGRAGLDHPALLTRTALLHTPKWISGHPPAPLSRGAPLQCSFKARYRQPDESCQVALADADTPEATAVHMGSAFGSHFECSRFTSLSEVSHPKQHLGIHLHCECPNIRIVTTMIQPVLNASLLGSVVYWPVEKPRHLTTCAEHISVTLLRRLCQPLHSIRRASLQCLRRKSDVNNSANGPCLMYFEVRSLPACEKITVICNMDRTHIVTLLIQSW